MIGKGNVDFAYGTCFCTLSLSHTHTHCLSVCMSVSPCMTAAVGVCHSALFISFFSLPTLMSFPCPPSVSISPITPSDLASSQNSLPRRFCFSCLGSCWRQRMDTSDWRDGLSLPLYQPFPSKAPLHGMTFPFLSEGNSGLVQS